MDVESAVAIKTASTPNRAKLHPRAKKANIKAVTKGSDLAGESLFGKNDRARAAMICKYQDVAGNGAGEHVRRAISCHAEGRRVSIRSVLASPFELKSRNLSRKSRISGALHPKVRRRELANPRRMTEVDGNDCADKLMIASGRVCAVAFVRNVPTHATYRRRNSSGTLFFLLLKDRQRPECRHQAFNEAGLLCAAGRSHGEAGALECVC
jgi:hypothetical protein